MEEILITILTKLAEQGIKWVVRKVVDGLGNCITQIVHYIGGDDGDAEVVVDYTFNTMIPKFIGEYCLCDKDGKLGLGLPKFELVDGKELPESVLTTITGTAETFLTDFDGDNEIDDIIRRLPDLTGDGVGDWGRLIDDNDNGVPDVSPTSPFFPVGTPEYTEIIARDDPQYYTIMNKPLAKYSVTEGILAVGVIVGLFGLLRKIFRRKKVTFNGL